MKMEDASKQSRNGLLALPFAIAWIMVVHALLLNFAALAAGDNVAEAIGRRLKNAQPPPQLLLGCEVIHAKDDLIEFYGGRQFAPLWLDEHGLNDLGKALPGQLAESRLQGLSPEDYHLSCINAMVTGLNSRLQQQKPLNPSEMADLDILMTDAFMTYASHLAGGKVDPVSFDRLWFSQKEKVNIMEGLAGLKSEKDLAATIHSFAPANPQYWALIAAAQELEQVIAAGGWPLLPPGRKLRQGDRDPQVPLLRKRLEASGELKPDERGPQADHYDEFLAVAVKKFQLRHGLGVDGVLGDRTRAEINVPAERRRQQILLNLERWRWLPHSWGENYIIVNTAAFSLLAHRGTETLTMRVIVGKDYQKTPIFSEQLRYIELNPYWDVPRSIAVKEMLPAIMRNPGYLASRNYELLSQGTPIDPWGVDWSTVSSSNFPFRIRQRPGAKNALGRIAFMFPNRFAVYMHDTPDRHLFNRARRDLSHGCIRLENPLGLAVMILQDDPAWTQERIEAIIATGKSRIINVKSEWMVHILYWTAWVDDYGQLQFCPDIYDKDATLWAQLNKSDSNQTSSVKLQSPGGEAPL